MRTLVFLLAMLAVAIVAEAQKIRTITIEINSAEEWVRSKEVFHRDSLVDNFVKKYFVLFDRFAAEKKKKKGEDQQSTKIYNEVVLSVSLKKGNRLEFYKNGDRAYLIEGNPFDTLVARFIKRLPEIK